MEKPGLFGMNGFIVFLLTCFSISARAQQAVGLILIDAENKEAFTIRIGNQMYASSAHGHLSVPHLKDSSYRLCLRFPKKNLAEQVFPVKVRQKDLGFILKGEDSSWVLYNWQTKETIHPVYVLDSSRILEMGIKRDDGFSRLMASVVNDTSVMYNSYSANSFHAHDTSAIGHRVFAIGGSPAAPAANASKSENKPVSAVAPPPAAAFSVGAGLSTKDSLIAVRRWQLHVRDSLNTVRKAAAKDSMALVKLEKARHDSLQAARKAFMKDSISQVKKMRKDSLQIAKAMDDSLKKVARYNASHPIPATAQPAGTGVEDKAVAAAGVAKTEQASGNPPPPDLSVVNHQQSSKYSKPPKKLREVSLKISRKMVFIDYGPDGHTDTVTLFVYFETKESLKQTALLPPAPKKAVKDSVVQRPVVAAAKMPDTAALNKGKAEAKTAKPVQTNCPQASDEDMIYLRSAILNAKSDQEKIAVASGGFALKCFTVAQVRQLASIFTSDKTRYRLMDAARMHIADREHFPELADMYTDKNFQRKFLALAENPS
jgi:Domain of unknown function (DUF4476)